LRGRTIESFRLLGVILAVKAIIAVVDHEPRFFMGDSSSYLSTAVDGWIPPDRSFLYGFFIRWVALPFQSVEALVYAQVLLSGFTVWIGIELVRRTGLDNRAVLWVLGLLWAVSPILLVYERFMMSEGVSLFVFALHLAVCVQFIKRPWWAWLVAMAATAFLLVALRVSYLPNVFFSAVVLPLLVLIPGSVGACETPKPWAPRLRGTLVYLILSVVLTGLALTGYKQLYASQTGNPPSYHSRQGYFMLATVAPLVGPSDFADPGLRAAVFAEGGLDLKDPSLREEQVWNGDGLLQRMERHIGEPILVDQLARETAYRVILNHPVKFVGLGWANAKAYLQPGALAQMVRQDFNRDRPLFGEFERKLIDSFSYAGDWRRESVTTVFFFGSIPWYMFLVALSLPLALIAIMVSFSRDRVALFVSGQLLVAFAVIMWLAVTASVRYLHTIEFLFLLTLGLTVAERWAKRGSSEAQSDREA